MWPSRFLPAPVASLSAALIFCVLTAASIASAEQTPGGPGHAGEPLVLAGSGAGAGLTRAVNAVDGTAIFSSQQFGAGFTGGVRVAVGDVNGDGIQDLIVGSGPGGGLVRVFSGLDHSMLMSFAPFGGGFSGGVYVASADIDGDGRADVIVGAGSGGRIAVFSGVDAHELERALPFTETYRGGVTVAAGDVDGDGHADLVVGTTIAGFVTALSGVDGHVITAGFPFGLFFVGGVSVAVGDLDRDGRGDIIVAQMSRGGRVLAYSGATLDVLASFVPYPGTNGVNLAAADVDGDGRADIITGPASGAPLVKIFSGADQHQMNAFLAFDSRLRGGVFVASNSEFVVPGAPTFTSAATAPWTVGSSDVFSITTSGSPTATITLSGALPAGLSFNGGSGRASISGTPTSAGSTTVNLTATNGLGVATQALTLAVEGAASSGDNKASGNSATATFTSAAAATFGVGAPGSFTVTTVANLDVTSILETGTLPTGVSFVDNGNGTATLSGTPAAGTHGVYPITFTASNGHKTAIQNFTLTVSPPSGGAPTITSANGVTFVVKARGSFTITTTGTAPVTITATGTMPSGVTLKSNGDGTATFAGTPAPSSAGTYPLTISASNGLGTATQAFTLTVTHANATPQFTSAASTAFTVGLPGTFAVTTSATVPFPAHITSTGNLPGGVTFTDNGNGTAKLAGTPQPGSSGIYALTFTAENGGGRGAVTQRFTLIVQQTASITSANNVTFTVGVAGSFTVTSAGTPTPLLTQSGALPTGVTFVDNGDGTATLSGTPAIGSGGSYPLTFTATNGVGAPGTQSFTLNVNEGGGFTSPNTATFTLGVPGTFSVTTNMFPAPTITVTAGALPTGLTLSSAGLLSGTPTQSGSFPVTLTATNGVTPDATQSFTVLVNAPPAITSANTATFRLNTPGTTFQVTMTGFPAPTVSVTAGTLPPGLTLSSAGLLSGTPTQFGSFPVTLTATNGVLPNATQSFTVLVTTPPAITSANTATFTLNTPGTTFQVTMTGFPPPTVSVTAGVLPSGLTLSPAGLLSGTPTQGGAFPVTLTATNGTLPNATQSFTVIVTQAPTFTSANAATFAIGAPNTFAVTTDAATATLVASGALPSGVTFTDNGNGTATLAGTPASGTIGTYPLTITASNAVGSATQSFVLTVANPSTPIITSAASATFNVGAVGSFTVTTAASPVANAITEVGGLPAGVTFVNNNDGTATLSGRPNAGTAGVYLITITASNGGSSANQTFTLTVGPVAGGAPTITSANVTTFVVGTPGTFKVTTTGTPTAAIIEAGALPSGVSFTDNGNGTATIAGTAAAGSAGRYPLTITASNTAGSAIQNVTLFINNNVTVTPFFTSAPSTTFTIGVAGTFSITTAATPTASSITLTGSLPAGVTFVNNGDGTATLSGTPAAGSAGAHALTFTASNGSGISTQSFTLSVQQVPSITSAASATFAVGAFGTFTVTTVGVPTAALTQSGALPSGVTFVDNGNGTATLSGTPAAGTGGAHALTFTAVNGVGAAATQGFTLNINDAGRFTSANSTTFTVGINGNFLVTTQAFPSTGTITRSGDTLPTGVSFSDHGDGTATLSGTPAAGTGKTYSFTFTFNNGVGGPVTQSFTLTVNQPPLFTSANSTTFTVGIAATPFTVTASGFPAPTITRTGGTLPTGATFTSATGVLAGTPTQTGAFPLVFMASNSVPPDATQNFTLNVVCPAITVSASSLHDGLFNTAYTPTVTFSQTGSTGSSFTWSATGLPTGLSIASTTGVVSGTPTNTVLNAAVAITVTDNFGCTGTRNTTITVRPNAVGDTFGNAVGNTQLAVGAVGALPSTPTAVLSGNVKTNDLGPGTLSVGFAGTSTNGGTIAEGTTDGSFLYTPAANFAGTSDTFTYTLTDGNGVTNTGTVTINFLNRVWYVNSSVAGPGDGRSNNPFNTLDKAATPSLSGDIVYVHTGGATTTGNLAMDANSTLQGAGGAVSLNGGVLVIPAGTAPTLTGTVTLANNTAIRNVTFSGASPAMTASGLATTLPSVIDGVSVSGGTNALSLTNVTATGTGAINVTNSSFTNTTAATVIVSGGNVPLSVGATITQTNAARAIDIQTRSGGAVTFSGAISATSSSTGVFLNGNTAGSFTFSGGVTLDGASSTFTSTNSGGSTATLTITGTNTIGATTAPSGPALNVANTTIGASGLTFRSINSTTASANSGIVLNTTGGSGGLIVTGIGTTAGSGGTISNKTAATGGISLTSTSGVSLSNMIVQSNSFEGIVGTNVNGFSLTGSSVTGNSNATNNRNGILLTDTTGAVSFVNDTVTGNHNFNAQLTASGTSTAAISTLTVTGGTYSNSVQNGGFLVDLRNTATLGAAFISGVTFSNNFSKGVQFQTNNNAIIGNSTTAPLPSWSPAPPNGSVTVTGCTFTNNNVAASFEGGGGTGGSDNVYYRFVNNGTAASPILGTPITTPGTGSSHTVIFANGSDSAGGTYKGLMSGNFIGNAAVAGSGSGKGNGVRVFMQGRQTAFVTIQNNTIRQVPNGRGIDVEALGPTGAGLGQTALDVKITGNDVNPNDTTGFPLYAIYVGADAQGSGTSGSNVHAEIHGNTVPTSSACDTQCSGSTTGMIFYETVDTSGQPLQGTKTGTLFQTGAGGGVSNEIATTNTGTAGKTCSFLNGGTLTLSATPPVTVARLSMPHLVPAAAMAHSVFAAGRSGAPALPPVAFIAIPMRRWSARGVTVTKEGLDG